MPTPFNARQLTERVWADLAQRAKNGRLPNFEMTSFKEFFHDAPQTAFSADDRRKILAQSRLLFSHFYVHAPFKRALGLLDPLKAIDELDRRLELENDRLPDDEFHRQVRWIFVEQEDAHTYYGLPRPYADALAFLPFQVKRCFDQQGHQRFIVSKLMPGFEPPLFEVGVEVTGWSGRTMLEALQHVGRSEVGGNHDAFFANALNRMTLRPLRFAERPDCEDEMVEFRVAGGDEVHSILIPWGVGIGFDTSLIFPSASPGCPEEAATFRHANLLLMKPQKSAYEHSGENDPAVDSKLPEVFEFQFADGLVREGFLPSGHLSHSSAPEARIGYIRIKSFLLSRASGPIESLLATEFQRILELMSVNAPDGLILDIRSNLGGSIEAAESMLQMISPEPITPARFHWRSTGAVRRTLGVLRSLRERFGDLSDEERATFRDLSDDYTDWLDEVGDESSEDQLTSGKPITSLEAANEVGQVYQGAVVLLVDAFTYSAADIFAGGFQDHGIGPVLGVAAATGGGGASKWNYNQFNPSVLKASGVPLEPLPGGVTLSLAVLRSSRVRGFNGQFIENIGVRADKLHRPTREDVLGQGRDLMLKARELLLADPRPYRLKIVASERDANEIRVRLAGAGYDSLQYLVQDQPTGPLPATDDWVHLPLPATASDRNVRLAIFGRDEHGKILVNTRANFPPGKSQ